MPRRAAHFLSIPQNFDQPGNHALISAMLEVGYDVDVYAPGPIGRYTDVNRYGPRVRCCLYEYGKRWWLRNAAPWKWHRYNLFSGTTEDPQPIVGLLAMMTGRPHVVWADEIRSGSYRGDSSERWKRLCRWAMRRARFTVVNDESRIPLQREYVGLPDNHPVLVYPNCFRTAPPRPDRAALRSAAGLPDDALVLLYSGSFTEVNGASWVIRAMRQTEKDVYLWLRIGKVPPLEMTLLDELRSSHRLRFTSEWVPYEQVWASSAAADIGLVFYHHDGPEFRNMGVSSTKLCMYLQMGLPVITNPQPSFRFILDYRCGVLIERYEDLPRAVETVRENYAEMSDNARRAIREQGKMDQRYEQLRNALECL